MADPSGLAQALGALRSRDLWMRALIVNRDRSVEAGRHAEAHVWNELACFLADLRDEESAVLRHLDFIPDVQVIGPIVFDDAEDEPPC